MASTAVQTEASVDNTFGPWAGPDVRGGFDFTLLFEESILSLLPIIIVLLVAPFRIFYLFKKENKLSTSKLLFTKLVCYYPPYNAMFLVLTYSVFSWVGQSSPYLRSST